MSLIVRLGTVVSAAVEAYAKEAINGIENSDSTSNISSDFINQIVSGNSTSNSNNTSFHNSSGSNTIGQNDPPDIEILTSDQEGDQYLKQRKHLSHSTSFLAAHADPTIHKESSFSNRHVNLPTFFAVNGPHFSVPTSVMKSENQHCTTRPPTIFIAQSPFRHDSPLSFATVAAPGSFRTSQGPAHIKLQLASPTTQPILIPVENGFQVNSPQGASRTELPPILTNTTISQRFYSATLSPIPPVAENTEKNLQADILADKRQIDLDHNYYLTTPTHARVRPFVSSPEPPVYIDSPSASAQFISTSRECLPSVSSDSSSFVLAPASSHSLSSNYNNAEASVSPNKTQRKSRPESPRKSKTTSEFGSTIPGPVQFNQNSTGPGTTRKEKAINRKPKNVGNVSRQLNSVEKKRNKKGNEETRCICDLTHDDGYMVCCDGCNVWQHVECISTKPKDELPEKYYCELCDERPVDKARARSIQRQKLESRSRDESEGVAEAETPHRFSNDGEGSRRRGRPSLSNGGDGRLSKKLSNAGTPFSRHNKNVKSSLRRKFDKIKNSEPRVKRSYTRKNSGLKSLSSDTFSRNLGYQSGSDSPLTGLPNGSLQNDDTISAGNSSVEFSNDGNGRNRPRKQTLSNIANGHINPPNLSTTNTNHDSPEVGHKNHIPNPNEFPAATNSVVESEYTPRRQVSRLSSYELSPDLENFEEAEVCHYSQELRARLKLFDVTSPSEVPELNESKSFILAPFGLAGGKTMRVLKAFALINPEELIIEFKGKFKLLSQFQQEVKKTKSVVPEPFVFFYRVPERDLDVSIDCKKFGNAARFVRRSCTPNAKLVSVLGKSVVHVYISASKSIQEGDEITIPHETEISDFSGYKVSTAYRLPCANEDPDSAFNCTCISLNPAKRTKRMSSTQEPVRPNNDVVQESQERKLRAGVRKSSSMQHPSEKVPEPTIDVNINGQENVDTTIVKKMPERAALSPEITSIPKIPIENQDEPKSKEPHLPNSDSDSSYSSRPREKSDKVRRPTVSMSSGDEDYSPPATRKAKEVMNPYVPGAGRSGRRRNRSSTTDIEQTSVPNSTEKLTESIPNPNILSREERKLQSLVKLINKMEDSAKKKENRTQKREASKKDGDEEQSSPAPKRKSSTSHPIKPPKRQTFPKKRKGKSKGRGGKPQLISQRSTGSVGDLRTTSTESDEAVDQKVETSFQPPKMSKQSRKSSLGDPVDRFPQFTSNTEIRPQYIRKSNAGAGVSLLLAGSNVNASTGGNTSSNCESWKKRYIRNLPSTEEVEVSNVNSPSPSSLSANNSRANSPTLDYVPPKKRRMARASMSSEVSSTPASPPNPQISDHDVDTESTEVGSPSEKKPSPASSEDEERTGNGKTDNFSLETQLKPGISNMSQSQNIIGAIKIEDQCATVKDISSTPEITEKSSIPDLKTEERTENAPSSAAEASVEKSNIERKKKMSILEYRSRKCDSIKPDELKQQSPSRVGSCSDSMESSSNSNDSSLFRQNEDAKNDYAAFSSEPTEAEKTFESMAKRKHLFDAAKTTFPSSFNGPSALVNGDASSQVSRKEFLTAPKLVTKAQMKEYHETTSRSTISYSGSLRSHQLQEASTKVETPKISASQSSPQVRPQPLPSFAGVGRVSTSSHSPIRANNVHNTSDQVIGGVPANQIPLPPSSPGQPNKLIPQTYNKYRR